MTDISNLTKSLEKLSLGNIKKMPTVKKTTTTTMTKGRQNYNKKKKNYNKKIIGTQLGRSIGFPLKLKFKHRYHEVIGLTSASGALSHAYFSVNSLYDPNSSGTGHQPMYFDQVAALYNHYTVIGSKITVKVTPQSDGAVFPYKVVTFINDDTTVSTGSFGVQEIKGAKTKIISGHNANVLTFTNKWSAKRNWGNVLANESLGAASNANPSEQQFYFISLQTLDGTNNTSVWLDINIEYITIWRELKEISES